MQSAVNTDSAATRARNAYNARTCPRGATGRSCSNRVTVPRSLPTNSNAGLYRGTTGTDGRPSTRSTIEASR